MFSTEIDKLLIEHIADLDEGARRFELLQVQVAHAIDQLFDKWSQENGWIPDTGHWADREDAVIAPMHWRIEENNWLAWFSLDFGFGDDGKRGEEKDYFWLTRLCREGKGQMGLRFDQSEFGKTPWKKLLKERAAGFADTRFILDDSPSLFLPIRIDKDALAKGAEEEDFRSALAPFTAAFGHVHSIIDRFDHLLGELRAKQA